MATKLISTITLSNQVLIEFEYVFEFFPILKYGYMMSNSDICIHPELILKLVPNVENSFYYPFI